MEESRKDRCAHETCGCPISPIHAPYCSAYCANVCAHSDHHDPDAEEAACACRHSGCTVLHVVPEDEDKDVATSIGTR